MRNAQGGGHGGCGGNGVHKRRNGENGGETEKTAHIVRRAAGSRAGRRPASTANLPTSPSCVVAADSLFASQSRETPGFASIASSPRPPPNPPRRRGIAGQTGGYPKNPANPGPGGGGARAARRPATGWRGSGGHKPLRISGCLRPPLPSPPGRATARREPSQDPRVRRICQLHPLASSQQIRSSRPEVVKLPAVSPVRHLHTPQACLPIPGE